MNWLKSTVLLISAVFLFLGTIGVDVFSHICDENGMAVSYFVEDESVCKSHKHDQHQDAHQNSCCGEKEEDRSCCETTVTHVQVKLDFANKIIVKPVIIPEIPVITIWEMEESVTEEFIHLSSGNDPPPLLTKERLVRIQTWLI